MEIRYTVLDELINKNIKDNIDLSEIREYSKSLSNNDIDGELIRSYYITYKNGINKIFTIYKENIPGYKNLVLTDKLEVQIEEFLECKNFDRLFEELIKKLINE